MEYSRKLGPVLCATAFTAMLTLAGVTAFASDESAEQKASEPSAENGEALFTENCATCHSGAVSPKPEVVGKLDREAFDEKVKNHMKLDVFETLTPEDLDDIYAYVRSKAEAEEE